jgi:two-component system, NarL family, response regulator LiaR
MESEVIDASGKGPLRAIVADDDPFARRIIKEALQRADIVVIAEARNGREAVELTLHYRPDAVLMDVLMPEVDGVVATRSIVSKAPDQVVIVLSSSDNEDLALTSLRAGAVGFLSKNIDVDAVPRAVRGALNGEVAVSRRLTMRLVEQLRRVPEAARKMRPVKSPLTPREWEVLDLLAETMTTEEIARTLVLSSETIRSHVKNILRKLRASSREEAVVAAQRMRSGTS